MYRETIPITECYLIRAVLSKQLARKSPESVEFKVFIQEYLRFCKFQKLYNKVNAAIRKAQGNGRTKIQISLDDQEKEAALLLNECMDSLELNCKAVITNFIFRIQRHVYESASQSVNQMSRL